MKRLPATVVLAGPCVIAALEWGRTFGTSKLLPVVVAAIVPVGIVLTAHLRRTTRRPLPVTGGVSAFGLVAILMVVAGPAPASVLDAMVNGWARLLTTSVPAPPDGDLLALPIATVWISALAGGELTLRSRCPALGMLPPAIAYLLALTFSGGLDGGGSVRAAVLLTFALATLLLLHPHGVPARTVTASPGAGRPSAGPGDSVDDSRTSLSRPRSRLGGLAVTLVSIALAVVTGPRLPLADARDPYDPRDGRVARADELATIDPLSLLAAWTAEDGSSDMLFTVAASEPQRWRLAVLDGYDPVSGWSRTEPLVVAGSTLPPTDDTGAPPTVIHQTVTLVDWEGPWLPAASQPVTVEGVSVTVDPDTNVIALRDAPTTMRGLRYDVTSHLPQATLADCTSETAAPLSDADLGHAPPDELLAEVQRLTTRATTACDRLRALRAHLTRDRFQFAPEAPTGANISRILELLDIDGGTAAAGRRQGTSEQYATALALMARAAGLPARVVVGFQPGHLVGGVHQVRRMHALAWTEVRFEGLGWIAVDATPRADERPEAPDVEVSEISGDGRAETPVLDAGVADGTVGDDTDPGSSRSGVFGPISRIALAITAAAALGASMFAVAVAIARRRRRSRRSTAQLPADRVVGAWRQATDALRWSGVGQGSSDTASDSAERACVVLGDDAACQVVPLATMVNSVVFGAWEPTTDEAATAWEHADRVAQLAAAHRTRGSALRRAFDIRDLVGR